MSGHHSPNRRSCQLCIPDGTISKSGNCARKPRRGSRTDFTVRLGRQPERPLAYRCANPGRIVHRGEALQVRQPVKLAVAVRDLASVPDWPETVPVAGRLVDLDREADDDVPIPKLALQDRRNRLAVRMRGSALASCHQSAAGRNVQLAVPDLDAGDDGGAVEERLPLELREAGTPRFLTRRWKCRKASSSRLRVPHRIRSGHSVLSGKSRPRSVSA